MNASADQEAKGKEYRWKPLDGVQLLSVDDLNVNLSLLEWKRLIGLLR